MSEVPLYSDAPPRRTGDAVLRVVAGGRARHRAAFANNYFTEMCSGSEAGSY